MSSTTAAKSVANTNHRADVPFFNRRPADWSINEYLHATDQPRGRAPREVLGRWKSALSQIAACRVASCCPAAHRTRAKELLRRYNQKGKGSDRRVGKAWIIENGRAASAPAPQTQTVNYGTLYSNATFQRSSVNNTNIAPGDDRAADGDGAQDEHAGLDITRDRLSEPPSSDIDGEVEEDEAWPAAAFKKTYAGFEEEFKWKLSSGRHVEDVLFLACNALDGHSPSTTSMARSWVVDLDNAVMQSWFEPDEWEELLKAVPKLPKPDSDFIRSLSRFYSVKTTQDLRRVLETTSYMPVGLSHKDYDTKTHFDLWWADVVLRELLMLFEADGEPLRGSHLEDWYTSYLWSPILDKCFLSLSGMTVERKESPCRATSLRKNRHRTETTSRLRPAVRLDGVIRSVEDDSIEYGGMEVARTFQGGTRSSKWLGDDRKLCKALRDMLGRLHALADANSNSELDSSSERCERLGKLQVVGIVTAGLAMQFARMCHTQGYVCLLKRERLRKVPAHVEGTQEALLLLCHVVQVRDVVRGCVGALKHRKHPQSAEELYARILKDEEERRVPSLPWTADTP